MPQRTLSQDELDALRNTAFGRLLKILNERRVPETTATSVPLHLHRDMHFQLTIERCDFDNADPYLRISETMNGVGFIFNLDGEMTYLVNYK